MFFWFAGLSFVLVALVFASPMIDYRLVMAGSVLPMVEMVAGGPWALQTLLAPVVVMFAVMVVARGNRLAQRRWLGLPIGMFAYLVLARSWMSTTLFWWPGFGWEAEPDDLPRWDSVGVLVVLELVGLAALMWAGYRYRLHEPALRRRFLREGRLSREVMGAPPGTC